MVGNKSNYSKVDILRCFLKLNESTSRQQLAKNLGLGEGTIRTILDMLKSRYLLSSTKKGHFLNEKGRKILSRLNRTISSPKRLTIKNIYQEFKKIGIVVRNVEKMGKVYNLRDIAVRNGADGAVILKFKDRLYILDSEENQRYKEIEMMFDFRNGDVLIIGFSDNIRNAENGALSIAIELSSDLQNFINKF